MWEMRKRSLKTFSSSIFEIETDPKSGQKQNVFKIDLKFLTEMLCFNNEEEARSFIITLGFKVIKNPLSHQFEVIKLGEPSEVWKPKTNVKYIESKRIIKSAICSRADIIRGVACTLKTQPKKKATPTSAPLNIAEFITPPKRQVSKPSLNVDADRLKKLAEKEEADKAREMLEKELKDKIQARKKAIQEKLDKDNALKEQQEKAEEERRSKYTFV